jgi:lysophospholipase L1-like esterase
MWFALGQPATATYSNTATASFKLPAMTAAAASNLARIGDRRGIVVIWGGTNDMALNPLATPAQTYANLQAYVAAARLVPGVDKVIVLTALPRTSGDNGNFETDRQAFNTLVRNGWASFADALVDVGNDANIGQAGDNLDTTYYDGDAVHLNNTGYGVVGAAVAAAVASFL